MKKVKVRIYKDPNNQGTYINKTAKFLQKAQYGMQTGGGQQDIVDTILDELTLDPDADNIASVLQDTYGLSYYDAMDKIDEVVSMLYKQDTQIPFKDEQVIEDETTEEPVTPPLYTINEPWVSEETEEDAEGWGDELAFNEDNIEDSEEMKKGGSISKKKFVKTVVRGLKKAADGMQQDNVNSASITDTPIDGRQSLVNNFRRGIKDLGNEYYAKEIYDKTNQPQPQQQPGFPMAQQGMEMDTENPMHHLQAYTGTTSNIFQQPMNDVHGAGYEMPQAKRGREQRQMNQANKDWQKAFGDIAAGYMGVPGLPNYLQVISPQMPASSSANTNQSTEGQTGPFVDFEYKKGPWWTGKREWSAKGIPAQMLMGMGSGVMPGMGYGTTYGPYSYSEESYSFPGKIVKKQVAAINSAADPTKSNNVPLNNNPAVSEEEQCDENGCVIEPFVFSTAGNWQMSTAKARAEAAQNEQDAFFNTLPYVQSMIPDDPSTGVMEDKVWSSPVDQAEFNRINQKLLNNEELTPEELVLINSGSYLTTDAQGNQYSSLSGSANPEWNARNAELYNNWQNASMQSQLEDQFFPDPNLPTQAFGGPVTNPQMDQMGNLQKFVYGGDEMSISPIVEYDNNDIQSKDVNDPFMYRRGGLIKAEPGYVVDSSKMDPANNKVDPAFQSPAFQQYNQNITSGDNYQAYLDLKNRGVITESYNPSKPYATAPSGQTTTQQQGQQTQQQVYPDGRGGYSPYPTAPSLKQQLGNMFSPFKINPNTGKNYDFMWMSQQGPATTADGKPLQIPSGQMPGLTGPAEPGKAGYMYDYKYEKGPWWSGKKTMTLTGRWVDPNNPNATGTTTNNNTNPTFKADENTDKIPDYLQNDNNQIGGIEAPEKQRSNVKGLEDESRVSIRAGERAMNRNNRRLMRQDPNAFYEGPAQDGQTAPMSDADYMAKVKANRSTQSNRDYLESNWGDVRSDLNADEQKSLDQILQNSTEQGQIDEGLNNILNTRSQRLQGIEEMQQRSQQEKINQQSMQRNPMMLEFGGYMPTFDPGGQFSGTGPFDPNQNTNGQAMGPCEEKDVMDPNSPCYNPNYNSSTIAPQDFSVTYDINTARTLNPDGILNSKQLVGSAIQSGARTIDNIYNDDYLNARTTADNREPVNELDYRGGYSGLNQRIMSKGQGRGSTGFNSVVGNAAFVKRGGQLGYQKGGEYDLTQEEIGRILAAGGQIEFI
jgi:hypothetical protein